MSAEVDENVDNRFEGMTFVLTGALDKYTRDEAAAIIEKFLEVKFQVQFLKRLLTF